MVGEERSSNKKADNKIKLQPVAPKNENPTPTTSSQQTNEQTDKSDHIENKRLMVRWTRVVALLTGALVFCGIVSATIFFWQLETMRGQLDEMRTDQRPWVSVNVAIDGPFVVSDTDARIRLQFTVKNTGRTPATDVHIMPALYAHDIPTITREEIETTRCRKTNINFPVDGPGLGYTLFPGDVRAEIIAPGFDRKQIEEAMNKKETLLPTIVVCISYRFMTTGGLAYTTSISLLSEIDPAKPNLILGIKPKIGEIPANRLYLWHKGSFGG